MYISMANETPGIWGFRIHKVFMVCSLSIDYAFRELLDTLDYHYERSGLGLRRRKVEEGSNKEGKVEEKEDGIKKERKKRVMVLGKKRLQRRRAKRRRKGRGGWRRVEYVIEGG